MKEKKVFILAIPTIIVIIIFIVGMSFMIYNKNYKPLDKNDALFLAKKALSIDNISCEVVTQSDQERIVDYKFKNNTLLVKNNNYIEFTDGNNDNKCTYIDTSEKEMYEYNSGNSIDSFKSLLYSAVEILDNDEYEYEFLKYEKVNGIKSASFKLENDNSCISVWLDRDNGMPIKIVREFDTNEGESTKITTIYRYQIGKVKDDDFKLPDTTGYNVMDME